MSFFKNGIPKRASWNGEGRLFAFAVLGVLVWSSFLGFSPFSAFGGKLEPVVLPPPKGIYHCAHPDCGFGDDQPSRENLLAFERLCGKKIVWCYISNSWAHGIRFPKEAASVIRNAGVIPLVGMMPWSSPRQGFPEKRYTLEAIARGDFDPSLREYAKDVKAFGGPVMIEFGPEVNGSWFPWNALWNGREKGTLLYKKAYRHLVFLFREEGALNITWVFHVASRSCPCEPWNDPSCYYPGDDVVDWIGASVYGHLRGNEKWRRFSSLLEEIYPKLCALSPRKPLALLEWGAAEEGEQCKAQWIREAFLCLERGRYPRIKAVSWWNKERSSKDGRPSFLPIDSSSGALNAYRQGVFSPLFVGTPTIGFR